MFRKFLAVLAVMVLGMSAANAQVPDGYYTGYIVPNCPTGYGVYYPLTESDFQAAANSGAIDSFKYAIANGVYDGPCQNIIQQPAITIYMTCYAMCQDDAEGAVNRAVQKVLQDYGCPGSACTLPADFRVNVDILVQDFEICNSYHWVVALETRPYQYWSAGYAWPVFEPNPPVSLHCQNEILFGHCGRGGED